MDSSRSEAKQGRKPRARNQMKDNIETILESIVKNIDKEEGTVDTKGARLIAQLDNSSTTFYNYGGWFFIEAEFPFVSYTENTGRIKIDLEEARNYYDIK